MVATAVSDVTTIPEALANTGIGMGTVFVVLILISFIISLFKFIPKLLNREKKTEERPVAIKTPAPAVRKDITAESAPSSDGQLAAVIAAAVAAYMTEETGVPVVADGLVIRSIKKRTISN